MSTHKPHKVTKNSGVAWLGEVPANWDVRRLGHFFFERREKVSDKDFSPLSVTKSGIVPQLETAAKTDDGDNRKRVRVGDFVINSRSDRKGSSGVSSLDGSVSLINTVLQPIGGLSSEYINHLLRSYPFQEEFYRVGNGIVADMWTTKYSEMKNIMLPVPNAGEQQAIADYLDRETARIHDLIERKTRFIELLVEKRQALITHAVTKGLNPNAKMKDSGVEWLGEVPEHWKVVALKRVVEFQRGHDLPDEARREGHVPIISSGGRIGFHDKAKAVGPGIVTGRYGSIGLFTLVEENYWPLNTALYSIDLHGNRPRYAWYLLQSVSEHFVLNSMKTAIPGVDRNDIHVVLVAMAPTDEQHQIVDHLDRATTRIDTLIAKTERSIELLREHRTALITAVVTGKIDLREAA